MPTGDSPYLDPGQDIYRLLIESVEDYAIILLDTRGMIRKWNKCAARIKGYTPDEIIGQSFEIFYTEEDRKNHLPQSYLKEAAEKGHVQHEGWRIRKDGSSFWANVTLTALYDKDKKLQGFSKVTHDLTAQKKADDEKKKTERVLEITNETARIGTWEIDLLKNTLTMSTVHKRIREIPDDRELSPAEGRLFFKEGEHRDKVQKALEEALKHGTPYDLEVIGVTATGREIWCRVMGLPEFKDGKCVRVFGMLQDIDIRKKTEEAKGNIEQVLDSMSETARIGAWEVDMRTKKVTWSRVSRAIHEVPDDYEQQMDAGISFYKEGEHLEKINHAFGEAVSKGSPFDLEVIQVTAKGREIWCRLIGQSEFKDGKCIRVFGIIQDIDKQKKTQIELQLNEEQFRNSFELSGRGMALIAINGKLIRVNKRLSDMLGYGESEIYSQTIFDITFQDDIPEEVSHARRLLSGEIDHYQKAKRFNHKNGSVIWANVTVTLVRNEHKQPVHFISEVEDITEKHRVQQILDATNETARIGAWEVDLATNTTIRSEVIRKIYDLPDDKMPGLEDGMNFFKEGEHRDSIRNAFTQAIQHGTPYDLEVILVNAKGREIWCRAIGQAEFKDGKCVRVFGILQDIDSQKRTQIELQFNEEQFRNSFELSGMGMALVSPDGIPIRVNKRLCEILGYSPQEFYALSILDITHPDDIALDMAYARQLLDGEIDHYQMTKRYLHKNGSIVWAHLTVSLVRDAQRQPVHFVSEVEDITEKKKIEDEKRKTELVLDKTSEAARIGAWEVDLITNTVTWSKVTRMIHEVPEDFQSDIETAIEFYKEGESRDIISHFFNEAVANGTPYDVEVILVTAKGREIWCRSVAQTEMKDGKCVRVFGIFQDVDIPKRMQIELQLSESQFRKSFDLSGMGMALLSLKGGVIRINKRLCELLGYTREELYHMTSMQVTYADDIAEDIRLGWQLLNGEIEYYHKIKRFVHKNGSIVWGHVTLSLVRDAKGNPIHFVCEVIDITERKKAEDQLKKVNDELKAIFNSGIRVSIIATDLSGTITHFNKGAEELFGYTAEEVVGKATPELIQQKDSMQSKAKEVRAKFGKEVKGFDVLIENVRHEGYESKECIYIRKDGSTFPAHAVLSPIKDENNNIVGYLGISTDITQIKEAEASIRKYALLEVKNKEMEQFTFIASHDLLEPLQTVSSFVGLLKEEYGDKLGDDAEKYIDFISGSTRRMMDLVRGLLHYSRIGRERKLEKVNCTELVKNVVADLGLLIADSKAKVNIGPLPTLQAFPLEMALLFQNLIANAIKFRRSDEPLQINISASKKNNKWTFVVADNGIGIAEKNRDKIFVIFQRLHDRHEYEGTGVGLAYCKRIVELHNGNIWVESTPGKGSTFYFTILT